MTLIFLVAGTVLATFSIQESYTEEIDKWNVGPSAIRPEDQGPSWTLGMQDGSFFELNISASDTVRVRIGTSTYNEVTGEAVLKNLTFDQAGTRFTQKIAIGKSGTYQVQIKNEGKTPVNIWGNVFAKKTVYQTVYPYSSLATIVVLGGLASLIYGVLTKPKKRRTKRKLLHKK